jgi:hypothetical protein
MGPPSLTRGRSTNSTSTSSKLLLALASTVNLHDHIFVLSRLLKWGLLFDRRRGLATTPLYWGSDSAGQPTAQSQSHVTTDGQSVSLSWCRAPSAAHDQMLITVWRLLFCWCLVRGRVCHLS